MSITTSPTGVTFDHAVDQLYRSFDDVGFRPDMPRCPHCVTNHDVDRLGARVRDLDPVLVARFVTKAGTTWGESDDLRRVAPRALHLAAEQRLPVNRAVLLHKLSSLDWAAWPAHQVDAVCRFLLAEWERLLVSTPRPGHSAHRWLRQTAPAMADLAPFLDTWQRNLAGDPGPAAVHLAVLLVNSELRPDFPATVANLFEPPAGAVTTTADQAAATDQLGTIDLREGRTGQRRSLPDQFGSWLAEPATEANLSRAATALDHTTDARRLKLAVDRLRRYRAARTRAG